MADPSDINKTPNWEDAIAIYLARCEGNGLSSKSIENYRSLLTAARAKTFRELHGVAGPADLSADVLEALKVEYRASGLSPHSVGDHYRAWRTFGRFCFDRGWLTSNAILRVQPPRQPKRAPRGFTDEDMRQLLAACTNKRDRVLVQFMVETGLRRQEVVNLTLDDVVASATGWMVRVRQGKGAKDRSVPMSTAFSTELDGYVKQIRPRTESRTLFLTTKRTGVDGDYAPLTGDGLYRIWKRLGKATGIRAYPHGARHTFATQLAQDGVAPWAIQRSLGHTTIDMTQGYVNLAAVDLEDAFTRRRRRSPAHRDEPAEVKPSTLPLVAVAPGLQELAPFYAERFLFPDADQRMLKALTSVALALARVSRLESNQLGALIEVAMTAQLGVTNNADAVEIGVHQVLTRLGYTDAVRVDG